MPKLAMFPPEKAILNQLHYNFGKPIHVDYLELVLGMSERLVRQCIHNLVMEGEPILSSCEGYWLAQTKEELDEVIASYMKSAGNLFKRAWRLKKGATYEEMAGLMKLAMEETK